jgi:purine-binding chemotaxis protein CheW
MSASDNGIDWDDVKRRLREREAALERASTADPERVAEVHARRAAELAARRTATIAAVAALRVLVFTLGAERHAIDFADLVEMLPFTACTPVPAAPPALLGVINLRGEIRSVLDLGRLLDLPAPDIGGPGYILVVRHRGHETALRVDAIDKVRAVALEELALPEDEAGAAAPPHLRGITPDGLRVLSTEALFAHPIFRQASH